MAPIEDPVVGILMLETRFPRPVGDVGNPGSWGLPVLYRTVPAATVETVVRTDGAGPDVLTGLIQAMRALEADGATLITTGCGFLGTLQDALAMAARVSVITNALHSIPEIRKQGAGGQIGVLTYDSRKLTPEHFAGAFGEDIVIEGIETGGELFPVISEDRESLDAARAEADVIAATGRLLDRAPDLTAIVMECTNLGPYRSAVEVHAGVPVHDIVSVVTAAARQPTSAELD